MTGDESVVVTATARLVAPFVFTFGLFTMFHGTDSAGGGFQGGVVAAAVVVLLAFAFGVGRTRAWLGRRLLAGLLPVGVVVFAAVGAGSLLLGGALLDPRAYPGPDAAKYAIELLELGIGVTVAAVVVVLFFELADGFDGTPGTDGPARGDRDDDAAQGPDAHGTGDAGEDAALGPDADARGTGDAGDDAAQGPDTDARGTGDAGGGGGRG